MARYIDADQMKRIIKIRKSHLISDGTRKEFLEFIDKYSTADVQEVKHGKWVEDNDGVTRCSKCGHKANRNFYVNVQELSDFCPNCGAKMNGKDD